MPETIKRRRVGRRSKSLRRRLRSWYSKNRYRANMIVAAVIASAIGLTLAFAMFDRGDGGGPPDQTVSATQ